MEERERIVEKYFKSWLEKDISILKDVFVDDAIYIESWGPAYRNLTNITKWFDEWNKKNSALKWDISDFFHCGNKCICEWFFEFQCSGIVDGFYGVSIVTFDDTNKIIMLKEFQSKTPNYYPYE